MLESMIIPCPASRARSASQRLHQQALAGVPRSRYVKMLFDRRKASGWVARPNQLATDLGERK